MVRNSLPEVAESPLDDLDDFENELAFMEAIIHDTDRLQRQNRRLTFQERAQPLVVNISYDKKKAGEMLRQNIEQVETLLERRTKPSSLPTQAFLLDNPKYKLGQWVDVKDTMGQWLEAQVTKLSVDKVRVHFNGWGARWDEWISVSSPRIAQFRTYTIQSPQSSFFSPYPSLEPDAQDHEIPEMQVSLEDLLKRYLMCYDESRKMMLQYLLKSESLPVQNKLLKLLEESKEEHKLNLTTSAAMSITNEMKETQKKEDTEHEMQIISAQLAPLVDRMGRILTDLSPQFSLITNNYDGNSELSFARFPAASIEQAAVESDGHYNLEIPPRIEPVFPLMPNAADVSSLLSLTEPSTRHNGMNMNRIIITITNSEQRAANNNSTRSESGTQT
jgi:hypothetical protein